MKNQHMEEKREKNEGNYDKDTKDFDDILTLVGEFGKYQRLIYVSLLIVSMLASMVKASIVFIEYTPSFRCKLPGLPNDTFEIQGEWHQSMVNITMSNVTDEECTVFHNANYSRTSGQNDTVAEKCTEWVFDTTDIAYSYPMQFSLVCDDSSKLTNSYIFNVLGYLVGGPLFGVLADVIGRKVALLLGMGVGGLAGVAWAFSPTYLWSIGIRFLYGFGMSGMYSLSSTLTLEMVGPNKRMATGTGLAIIYAGGGAVATGIAYFLRDWRHLSIAVSAAYVLLACAMIFFLPESPRWLLTKGAHAKAEKILKRASKINKTYFPKGIVEKVEMNEPPTSSARALLHAPKLVVKMLLLYINWLVLDMTYYGINLHAGNMAGDIYLNIFLLSIVEIPAYTLCFTIDRFGRKRVYIMCMVVGGLACLSSLLVQRYADNDLESTNYIKIALSTVGKFGVAAGYNIVYIWSIEIFPTVVRNFSLGLAAVCASCGSILAPVIVREIKVDSIGKDTLPLVIFGAAAIFGSMCTIPLPETAKKDLPETVEEANSFKYRGPYGSSPNGYQVAPGNGLSESTAL
ncbi:organic cation transporter protein [Lingula anatina]|uniref:Organic cation transporter protein n=1 Tax=Lingula anatina TaxID=7574 RepID=A0A1S3J6B4_LINAN|nr:organic cation transporter protein [Lingula anatina]|eukprot:XP_013405791.1 organic cation transporter protein [Lingula anatina]